MRIVLDTEVLARAIAGPQGPAGGALSRIRPPHVLILSAVTLAELARVLTYDRVRRLHALDDAGIDRCITDVETAALIVASEESSRIGPDDPDDDVIVAAVAGGAHVICTLDRHFDHDDILIYARQHGIRVVSDGELLQLLRDSEDSRIGG